MTQYYSLNVKLSNSQLNKLKLGIKNGAEVTLNLSLNVIGNSNDETSFPHKLLSTDKKAWRLGKAFANNSSANIFIQNHMIKMIRLEGFLFRSLGIPFKCVDSLATRVLE